MATPTSAAHRSDWARSDRPSPRRLRFRKAMLTLLFLTLLIALVVVLAYIRSLQTQQTLRVFTWTIDGQSPLEAPAMLYVREDVEALQATAPNVFDNWQETESQRVTALGDNVTEFHEDVVVFYVAAPVACDAEGEPFLMCSNFNWAEEDKSKGRYNARQLLEAIDQCPAAEKLLVIDIGRSQPSGRVGVLLNEFPEQFRKLVADFKSDNKPFHVLTSNSLLERSHVSHADRRSAFGHFVAEALSGAATVDDNQLTLDEVHRYVLEGVNGWVAKITGSHVQNPELLRIGEGPVKLGDARTQNVVVRTIKPPAKEGDAEAEADAKEKEAKDKEKNATDDPAADSKPADKPATAEPVGSPPPAANKDDAAKPPSQPAGAGGAAGEAAAGAPKPADTPGTAAPAPTKPPAPKAPKPITEDLPKDATLLRQVVQLQLDAERLGRPAGVPWTAIDFAPHQWREIQETLVSWETRFAGKYAEQELGSVGERLRLVLLGKEGKLIDLMNAYRRGPFCAQWEQDEQVGDAIREMNRALFELPYYIQLLGDPPGDSPAKLAGDINALIDDLDRLADRLGSLKSDSGSLSRRDLGKQIQQLISRRSDILNQCKIAPAAAGAVEDPDYVFADQFAATPLPDLRQRVQLRLRQQQHAPLKHGLPMAGSDKIDNYRLRRWRSIQAQGAAHLRIATWLLGPLPEITAAKTAIGGVASPQLTDAERCKVLRDAGTAIRSAHNQLRNKLAQPQFLAETADPWLANRIVRLVDARDVAIAEKRFDPNANPLWLPVEVGPQKAVVGLTLHPPSDEPPIPLRIDTATELTWTVRAPKGDMPSKLTVRLEPDPKLIVEDHQDSQEFTLDVIDSRAKEEFQIKLKVRAMGEDTAQPTLRLKIIGRNLQSATAFALPAPRWLRLAVHGQVGTVVDPPGVYSEKANERGTVSVYPPVDDRGRTQVGLMPFPRDRTPYHVTLDNPASKPRQIEYTLYAIPLGRRAQPGFEPWSFRRGYEVLVRHKMEIGPLTRVTLPLFQPPPPPPEKKEGEAAAPPAAAPPANDEPKTFSVPDGLIAELKIDGSETQTVWFDIEVQHPERYLDVKPEFVPRPQRKVSIDVQAGNDPQRLPLGITVARWEFPNTLMKLLEPGPRLESEQDLRDGTLNLFARVTPNFLPAKHPVVVSVDGYPRAFEFAIDEVQGAVRKRQDRWHAQLQLLKLVDKTGLPEKNDNGNYLTIENNTAVQVLKQIGVRLQIDVPPPGQGVVQRLARIYIKREGEDDNDQAGESEQWIRDRNFSVQMSPLKEPPGAFELSATVDDLVTVLKNRNRNTPIRIAAKILEVNAQGQKSLARAIMVLQG